MFAPSEVAASLAAQMNETRLGHCDPGCGVGYRIAFYGDETWEQAETSFPVMTREEAVALIGSAEALSAVIGKVAA